MARRLFTFDFSKYRFLYDDVDHDFRVYREDEDVTAQAMNNPLLDLLLAYNNLYEKAFIDREDTLSKGIMYGGRVDLNMSIDKYINAIHYGIKGINPGIIELLADDIFDYINKRILYYKDNISVSVINNDES